MAQNIIRALKNKFHRSLALKLLQRLDSTVDNYKLSLLDAISVAAMAWNSVSNRAVANWFKKAEVSDTAIPNEQSDDNEGKVVTHGATFVRQ